MILTLLLAYLAASVVITLLVAAFMRRTRERVTASLPVRSDNVVPLRPDQDPPQYDRRAA